MRTRLIIPAAALACVLANPAFAQPNEFQIHRPTIAAGGGRVVSNAGTFAITATIGQPIAGPVSSMNIDLYAGFWTTAGGFCRPDFNNDGFLNSQDFFEFLGHFFNPCDPSEPLCDPLGDYNRDGFINSQDFFDFLTAFFAGC